MNVAAKIARPLDNNPITLLMLRSGKDVVVTPPDGLSTADGRTQQDPP